MALPALLFNQYKKKQVCSSNALNLKRCCSKVLRRFSPSSRRRRINKTQARSPYEISHTNSWVITRKQFALWFSYYWYGQTCGEGGLATVRVTVNNATVPESYQCLFFRAIPNRELHLERQPNHPRINKILRGASKSEFTRPNLFSFMETLSLEP